MVKKIYAQALCAGLLALSFIGLDTQAAPAATQSREAHRSNIIKLNRGASLDAILKGNPYVVVDFGAVWCGPCKNLAKEENLGYIADQFKNVKFVKVDGDESKDLTKKYGVCSFPTLIYFKDGKQVERQSGFSGRAQVIRNINENFGFKK